MAACSDDSLVPYDLFYCRFISLLLFILMRGRRSVNKDAAMSLCRQFIHFLLP